MQSKSLSLVALLMRPCLRILVKRSLRADSSLDAARRHVNLLSRLVPRPPPGTETISVDAGGVKADRIATSASRHDRHILYLHGGSYVAGWPGLYRDLTWRLAALCRARVLCIDYRLAPEHPFPAALDDAWAATTWVTSHAEELKLDPDRIGVGGDSAGGTLAAVVARRGRDHAVPIALQLLLYPVTNVAGDTPSYSLYSSGYGLTRDGMGWYWQQYLAGADGTNPDASPAQVTDLRRLPRAIVVTAEADILRDEAEAYAQRMFLATVETEGYRYDGMIHGFLRMAGKVERANAAYDELAESIRTMLDKTWRT
jgi:acetyl esterase